MLRSLVTRNIYKTTKQIANKSLKPSSHKEDYTSHAIGVATSVTGATAVAYVDSKFNILKSEVSKHDVWFGANLHYNDQEVKMTGEEDVNSSNDSFDGEEQD